LTLIYATFFLSPHVPGEDGAADGPVMKSDFPGCQHPGILVDQERFRWPGVGMEVPKQCPLKSMDALVLLCSQKLHHVVFIVIHGGANL